MTAPTYTRRYSMMWTQVRVAVLQRYSVVEPRRRVKWNYIPSDNLKPTA
ncbi:hypothetical protein J3U28_02235 [Gilliamella sp. B3831]|nr:hypothetical protein [Gilliamella sp. B3831]